MDTIPEDIYRKACVYTTEEALASCQVVGYPAMIKASWGGGGKGIRKVCLLFLFYLYKKKMRALKELYSVHGELI